MTTFSHPNSDTVYKKGKDWLTHRIYLIDYALNIMSFFIQFAIMGPKHDQNRTAINTRAALTLSWVKLVSYPPGEAGKWDTPLLPYVPFPSSHRTDPPTSRLRGLRQGQRMALGGPMCDPDTGVPVPILAVTIHPQTGLVYPLGGLYECPFTHLPQPIQIGSPFLDPHTGSVVLATGVCLDQSTGRWCLR